MSARDKPKSFQEFYNLWEAKIRTTVRNNTKIAYHEIDDVVQTVFTACVERKWLDLYDGTFAFSTFIYTYVLQEIRNYINKRDSSNTISSSGATRYTSFSSLFNVDSDSIGNFIDKVEYNYVESSIDFASMLDLTVFWDKAKEKVIVTLRGDVSCFRVITFRLNIYLGLIENPFKDNVNTSIVNDHICAALGISPLDLQKVDKSVDVLSEEGVEAAVLYLDEKFL